jgi:hypothetical protein
METHEGMKVQLHAFLTLALDEREYSASRFGRFTPRKRGPVTHKMDPRADLLVDAVQKSKYLPPAGMKLRLLGHLARILVDVIFKK